MSVVRQALPLSAEEASAFGPLHLQHEGAPDEVRDERLVLDFVEKAPSMSDIEARAHAARLEAKG